MVKDINIIYQDKQYIEIVRNLLSNGLVQKMKKYRQHYEINCFYHCLFVSYNAYRICKKYNLDYISVARAGMVHDLFLYDWRKRENGRKGLHAFTHPKLAQENALKVVNLNEKEKDIILKHMWPLTIKFPKFKESYILSFVDKYFAVIEKNIKIEDDAFMIKL